MWNISLEESIVAEANKLAVHAVQSISGEDK